MAVRGKSMGDSSLCMSREISSGGYFQTEFWSVQALAILQLQRNF